MIASPAYQLDNFMDSKTNCMNRYQQNQIFTYKPMLETTKKINNLCTPSQKKED